MKKTESKNTNEAYQLFVKLEGKEMLGKKFFNFWVLVVIFVLTMVSVSFSHAGLDYLRYKMEDPFINWVDIVRQGNFDALKKDLNSQDLKKQFHYSTFEKNQNMLYLFRSVTGKDIRFEGRTVAAGCNLLTKILDNNNVLQYKGRIYPNDYGLIITHEMATKLGLSADSASFVEMAYPLDDASAKNIGLVSRTGDAYFDVSLPVVAIVKQLPDMMSFMATPFFFAQRRSVEDPFDLTKPEYNNHLTFYFPAGSAELQARVKKDIDQQLTALSPVYTNDEYLLTWNAGQKLMVNFNGVVDTLALNKTAADIVKRYKSEGVARIYDFNFHETTEEINPDYISVYFNSLDSIRSFQEFVKDKYEVKIDMSQIDSKENFNFVNNMGIALSLGFVVLSCIFIFAFIFYLLRTHFLKIKKNLGTFKAFGVSNAELTQIYMSIMMMLTTAAFLIAFLFTLILQYVLHLCNCQIDINFAFLNVFSPWTLGIFILAILTSVMATWMVTYFLLRSTPGDLIYDRDN